MSHHRPMGAPGQKATNFKATLARFIRQMRPERAKIILVLIISALAVAMNVAGPKLLGEGTNLIFAGIIGKRLPAGMSKEQIVAGLEAKGQHRMADMLSAMDLTPGQGIDFGALAFYVGWVLALYVGAALLMFIAGYIVRTVVQNMGWRLRDETSRKVNRIPLSHLDKQQRGDLLSRVTNDVDNITQTLNQTLSQLFTSVLTVLGIIGMMLSISWQLALLTLLAIPLMVILSTVLIKRAQPHFSAQWVATGDVAGVVEEAFTGAEVVRLYGLEEDFAQRFDGANQRLRRASFLAQAISTLMQPLMTLVSNLSYVVVAVAGGLMVAHGQISLGGVQAFIQYSRQFMQPLGQLMQMANLLQSGLASAERVFEFLDAPEMRPESQQVPAAWEGPRRGLIRFEDVCFSYEAGHPIIQNLNLEVKPGQSVAIVGPTGAGKTTLVNLLMRFYELDSGRITIDGVDIATLPTGELRRQMGMVLQDTWLLEGTISENIGFGNLAADESQIVAAAQATSVHHLVSTLPEGYATHIEDGAEGLSAGEKQLITIARAFISDPAILILDEATSSVDTRTEMLVARAMNRLRQGRTSFVIAHRLSTIRDADLILVMENGSVVETGNHESLLAAGGAYARLYNAQFAES